MKPFIAVLLTLPLLNLSCAPTELEIARRNFNARPVDNSHQEVRFTGHLYAIDQVDVPPKPIGSLKAPRYPNELRKIGGTGAARIAFVVDTKGNITQPHIIQADDQLFADSVIEATKTWKFVPARKDGKNVSVWWILPVRFKLADSPPPFPVSH
jgi:TonB family protein